MFTMLIHDIIQAQCIDRLMEAFAGQQYLQGKGSGRHPFVSADAAFTMAFSAIMLNTDLHNPQIQDHRRMTLDDFFRNNRFALVLVYVGLL